MKIQLTLLFLFIKFSVSAQFFLGPTVGYDFASLQTNRIFQETFIGLDGQIFEANPLIVERAESDKPSRRRSIVFGFQVQKILPSKWSFGLRGHYSKKEYLEHIYFEDSFLIPTYEVFYQQIGISALISRKINEKISIGIGPNISLFSGWNTKDDENYFSLLNFNSYTGTKRGYGIDLQIGHYLGPIYLALDYTKMLKVTDSSEYMTGASSLAILVTYFFELKKWK